MRVLLLGNPNAGKSSVFHRLTGLDAVISNYPGTTVEVIIGTMKVPGLQSEVVDLPGIYSLEGVAKAEEVAARAVAEMGEGDIVVSVVNATNLERSLNLTLQVLKLRRPALVALNFWDETEHEGVRVDAARLEGLLGVPCVPVAAVSGYGIRELVANLSRARVSPIEYEDTERWHEVGKIAEAVQAFTAKRHTPTERMADAFIRPFSGIPIALGVAFVSLESIRLAGAVITSFVVEPFFRLVWSPVMMELSAHLGGKGFWHDFLVGRLAEGKIDYGMAMGLLTTGLYIPLAEVYPYVAVFYVVLSVLEDSGYLPRLAVLSDRMMHAVGLHGMGILPFLLGVGCKVTGVMATRIMDSAKERFIAIALIGLSVPCTAQIAVLMALAGSGGFMVLAPVFASLGLVAIIAGHILARLIGGESPEILIDMPPVRLPRPGEMARKLLMRLRWFLKEAVPWVVAGVALINLLNILGVVSPLGRMLAPVVTGLFGLPAESASALLMGLFRKDVAVGVLAPLHLGPRELAVAGTVLTMFFPCAATFAVMVREVGWRDMLKIAAMMVFITVLAGAGLNVLLGLVPFYAG